MSVIFYRLRLVSIFLASITLPGNLEFILSLPVCETTWHPGWTLLIAFCFINFLHISSSCSYSGEYLSLVILIFISCFLVDKFISLLGPCPIFMPNFHYQSKRMYTCWRPFTTAFFEKGSPCSPVWLWTKILMSQSCECHNYRWTPSPLPLNLIAFLNCMFFLKLSSLENNESFTVSVSLVVFLRSDELPAAWGIFSCKVPQLLGVSFLAKSHLWFSFNTTWEWYVSCKYVSVFFQ